MPDPSAESSTPVPLVRIVRMTFHPDVVDDFIAHFDQVSPHIRAFAGCRHLELWRDDRYPNICTTYSQWDSTDGAERVPEKRPVRRRVEDG